MRQRGGVSVLLVTAALVLTACTSDAERPSPAESSRSAEQSRNAACADAVTDVVEVTQRFVDGYGEASLASTPTAAPGAASPTSSPDASPATDEDLQEAVARAQDVRRDQRCDDDEFRERLESGLDGLVADGAVAAAVLRQVRANLTGRVSAEASSRSVTPADDLPEVLAEVGPGATVELAPGEYRLGETLVLLRGVTLRGAGADRTTIRSSAPDASVLVVTGDRTALEHLSVRRSTVAGSVLVGGSAASVRLDGVRFSGARTGDGEGGAGVLMTAVAGVQPRDGTTLEVTGSTFADNDGAGIALGGDHRASIVSSRFARNEQCGVCFLAASGGAVRRSTFAQNGAAVAVNGTARPLIKGSSITGGEVGVQAVDDSAPVLDGNRISRVARAAVIWSGKSSGRADRTRCRDVEFGLVVGPSAHPFLGDNDCPVAQGR